MENEVQEQEGIVRRPYPNLKQAFLLLALSIAAQIAIGIVFAPALIRFGDSPLMGPLVVLLVYVLTMGFVLWFAQRERQRHYGSTAFKYREIVPHAYPLIFLLTLASIFLMEPIIELIPVPEELWDTLFKFVKQKDIFTFLTVVIAAPIFEELIFRGVILDGLLKNYHPAKAIFWSSFIFGVVHLNPWQFIPAFLLGLVMGWLYLRSQSLWPCIFVHFVANGSSFVTRFFIDLDDPEALSNSTRAMVGEGNYSLLLISSLGLTLLCFFALNKVLTKV